jgi:hypothetical protein
VDPFQLFFSRENDIGCDVGGFGHHKVFVHLMWPSENDDISCDIVYHGVVIAFIKTS